MTYQVVLTHTEEGISVNCPALPGCWSEGETEAEALANIQNAIREYLAVEAINATPKEMRYVEVEPARGEVVRQPFRVTARPLGLPPGMSYEKMSLLLEQIEQREDEVH